MPPFLDDFAGLPVARGVVRAKLADKFIHDLRAGRNGVNEGVVRKDSWCSPQKRGSFMPEFPMEITELSAEQQEAGLRLALRDLEETQFRGQVAEFRRAENAELAARLRIWGIFRENVLIASVFVQTQPGRTAMLWPPRVCDGAPGDLAARVLEACLSALAETDVRLMQSLLPTDSGRDAELLGAAGFRHFSDLLYLVCPASEFPAAPLACDLEFAPVECIGDAQFAALVEATYEGTLDCPAVNGLRNTQDTLLGYRATGSFVPQWWLVVRRQGENIGCLILADYPPHETCELIYIGLAPAARGRGLGLDVIRHALWLAAAARRQRLVLAVDAANEPALRMYAAAGFQAWDRKSVFIRVMG